MDDENIVISTTTDINTGPVALIFEGGGMRAAYTASVVTTLLHYGINFPKVYGISAGASLAADYLARNGNRAKAMFTDVVKYHKAGGAGSFLRGHGFFDTRFVFEELSEDQSDRSSEWFFDFDEFRSNPADIHIEAFDITTGETAAWTKADMNSLDDLMKRVAASCSYPLFTPDTVIDKHGYIDGGMGKSHGICLQAARNDGFDRFFIVRSQPRSYRMPPLNFAKKRAYQAAYARYPLVYEAICARPQAYNLQLDEIDRLEKTGQAYVFCPTVMPISYMTADRRKLEDAYQQGLAQCRSELTKWLDWIYEL